jgi:hypothetical protein
VSEQTVRKADPVAVDGAIRPFTVEITEEDLVDLPNRARAARLPEKEIVGDQSQVQAAFSSLRSSKAMLICSDPQHDQRRSS